MTALFIDIKTKCASIGTNLTEVCQRAGVHRSVPERWKSREPKTRRVVEKIYAQLENMGAPMDPEPVAE